MLWLYVYAEDIIFGNLPDIFEVMMVHLLCVEAMLALLALLTKMVWLLWIKLEKLDACLICFFEKNNNWTFNFANDDNKDANAKLLAWLFWLDNIFFDQGWIAIDDKVSKVDLEIFVDPLGKLLLFSEVIGSKGKVDKEKVGDYVFGLKA